jgi:hypothetical protein
MQITNYFLAKQELNDAILRMVRERPDLTHDEIADALGVTRAMVHYRAKLAGIKRPKGRISGQSPQKAGRQ